MTFLIKPASVVFAETGPDWGADVLPGLPSVCSGVGFSLECLADRYVFHNVAAPFSDGQYTLELSRSLLDNNQEHSLTEWASNPSLRTLGGTVWDLPTCPEYFSMMLALEEHQHVLGQEALVAEVKALFLRDFMLPRFMTTGTVVRYGAGQSPTGLPGKLKKRYKYKKNTLGVDVAIHRYGTSHPDERKEALIGPDVWVAPRNGQENGLYALCGVRDLGKMIRAVEFVTGKIPFWYRVNTTPTQDIKRVLVLGGGVGRFYVNADGLINVGRPARGVVVREKSSFGTGGSCR